MATMRPGLSLIMPVFNEEAGVRRAIEQNIETMQVLGVDFELVVVDDKSRDNTRAIVEEIARETSQVKCLCHQENQGAGGGFRSGVFAATKEYVMLVPADNPMKPEDIEPYISKMPDYDIIVGVRETRVGYPWFTRFASYCYNRIMVPVMFGVRVKDVNWIQAYRRRLFSDGLISIDYTGIFFLAQILSQARRHQLEIVEVPARMQKRVDGKPTIFRISVIWRTFKDMLHYYFITNREGNHN